MGQYILKRLLMMVPTLFGITLVTFFIIRLAPGDPVAARLGTGADMSAGGEGAPGSADKNAQIVQAKVRMGLLAESGRTRLWQLSGNDSRAFEVHARDLEAILYAPDGSCFATGGSDGEASPVRLWSPEGQQLAVLTGPLTTVTALAFSPDSGTLACVAHDRHLRLYQLAEDRRSGELLFDREVGERLINAVAFSPDGKQLATGSRDQTVRTWDAATGEPLATMTGHFLGVTGVVYLPDGRLISASRDRTIFLWQPDSSDPARWTKAAEFAGVDSEVLALALSPDATLLAAGLGNNAVGVWDVATHQRLHKFMGHTGAVRAVSFAPSGAELASGGLDKTIRIWPLAGGQPRVLEGGHLDTVVALAHSPGEPLVLLSGARDVSEVPLLSSYLHWLVKLCKLELGTSSKDGRPVRDKIFEAFPVTLKLNLIAIFITYLLSIPLGVYAGAKRNGFFDQASSLIVFLLYSMPSFWVATMLIVLVGSNSGFTANWFGFTLPYLGLHSDEARRLPYIAYQLDHWKHMILPMVAFTYSSFAFLSRLARNNMLDVLSQDYVRTARAKGLSEARVIGVHAFRNSLISIVTIVGNILPTLIGGSVIIESIYNIPGMGLLGFNAILQRDYAVIMAITTFAAVLTMLGILLSDLLYCLVDPRIQLQ